MKHYLFYIHSFAGGGAERVAVMLAGRFHENGHTVSFVVNRAEGPLKQLLAPGISLHELNPGSHPASVFLFAALLRKTRPDYIHCRIALCPLAGVLGALLAGMPGRVVISYHNPFYPEGTFGGRLVRYAAPLLTRLSFRTICVSSDIKNELRDRFRAPAGKLVVIHNPVDMEEINLKSHAPFPAHLNAYQEGRPYILSVGRLTGQKDFPTLIRAFHQLHKNIPHDLIILGRGPLEHDLGKLSGELGIKDRVILPGFVANPFPLFRRASLFALSSLFEGFGNVLIEALAVGTPIVSTDCPGGPGEILAHGRYGRLVPVGDSRALAEAMQSTLADPPAAGILQGRAENFSLARVSRQYLELFSEIDTSHAP